jgi:hypothetical protein
VRDFHVREVAHDPVVVVETPNEVDVFTEFQFLVKSHPESVASNHETRGRYVVHRSARDDDGTARTHVKRAEPLFEAVANT